MWWRNKNKLWGGGAAYLDRIIVYPEHRGNGIGTKLLEAAEDWAISVSAVSVVVVFSPDNPRDHLGLIEFLKENQYECNNFSGIKIL